MKPLNLFQYPPGIVIAAAPALLHILDMALVMIVFLVILISLLASAFNASRPRVWTPPLADDDDGLDFSSAPFDATGPAPVQGSSAPALTEPGPPPGFDQADALPSELPPTPTDSPVLLESPDPQPFSAPVPEATADPAPSFSPDPPAAFSTETTPSGSPDG